MALKWLSTGAESTALAKKEALSQEMKREQKGKLFRFWVSKGEECRITFIDGALNAEGFLEPPRFYEHNLMLQGKWGNTFVCPQLTAPHLGESCPICAGGDTPSLVSLFTIIDHRQFKSKDGTKVYKDTRKLFVAKTQSMEMLQKIAVKRGGLAGCMFDVSRMGDLAPAIGSMFDFVEKHPIEELQAMYMEEVTDPKTNAKSKQTYFVPANYDEEIPFMTGEQLTKMGLGAPKVSGYTPPGVNTSQSTDKTDYSSQL